MEKNWRDAGNVSSCVGGDASFQSRRPQTCICKKEQSQREKLPNG
jgi:hypothetical protein